MSTPDPDLIAHLAALVAKPGAPVLYLNADNEADGWDSSTERAARSGRTFAVEVQDTIFAVDCDEADLVLELDSIEQGLREENIEPVRLLSGGDGREHLFAHITDPRRLRFYEAHVKGLGLGTTLEVRRKIRPPLSPHRLGHDVALIRPDNAAEAVAALTPRRPRDLSPEWMTFLKDGAPKKLRSGKIVGFCLAAVNAAWTFGDVYWAMMDPANLGGEKVRERRDPLYYLDRWCWQLAVERAERSPAVQDRAEAEALIARIAALARKWDFGPRTGERDRRVIRYHLDIAARTGKIVHTASLRHAVERTGLTYGAIRSARESLVSAGWLRPDLPAARWTAEAASWRVSMPPLTAASLLYQSMPHHARPVPAATPSLPRRSSYSTRGASDCMSYYGATADIELLRSNAQTLSHDGATRPVRCNCERPPALGDTKAPAPCCVKHLEIWRRWCSLEVPEAAHVEETPALPPHDVWRNGGGLGSQLRRVYEVLDETAFRSADYLALGLGLSRKTLMKYLTKLQRLGLAMRTDAGWVRGCASLDQLAFEHDVHGRGEAQRKAHETQRAALRTVVEEWEKGQRQSLEREQKRRSRR